MEISFQYTPQTLQRAHELHYKVYFPLRRKALLILGIMALWAGVLLFLILGAEGSRFLSFSLISYGIIAIVIHFYFLKTTGKRAYKKLGVYHDTFHFNLTEDNIIIHYKENEQVLEWSEIKKAVIARDMTLLYPTDTVFFIFPKKNFTDDRYDSFTALIEGKVTQVKKN